MTLRSATLQDADGVAAIWNHYIRNTTVTFNPVEKTVAEVAETIATRPAFFVAEHSGRIVGFSTYDAFRPGSETSAARNTRSCWPPMPQVRAWTGRC